jgi:hypothetical protein
MISGELKGNGIAATWGETLEVSVEIITITRTTTEGILKDTVNITVFIVIIRVSPPVSECPPGNHSWRNQLSLLMGWTYAQDCFLVPHVALRSVDNIIRISAKSNSINSVIVNEEDTHPSTGLISGSKLGPLGPIRAVSKSLHRRETHDYYHNT